MYVLRRVSHLTLWRYVELKISDKKHFPSLSFSTLTQVESHVMNYPKLFFSTAV